MSLKQFNLQEEIVEFLSNEKKINKFTYVQKKSIPLLLKQKSIFVESPTGTGKTYAFLLPIINKLDVDKGLQAIIFSPTNELVNQIYQVAKEFQNIKNFSIKKISNSDNFEEQKKYFKNNINLIVTTPEKFLKLFVLNKINLNDLNYLIIDEADMMLDFGFMETISNFKKNYLSNLQDNLVWGFFSATFPKEIQNFIKNNLKISNFQNINIIDNEKKTIINLININENRGKKFIDFLNSEKINPYFCIIFCSTNKEVEEVYDIMKKNKIASVEKFNSTLRQREKNKVMNLIKNDKLVFLVTTDLISRGMDFNYVSHIINYSLPKDLNFYKHRIGRTNRNNKNGIIYDLYSIEEKSLYDLLKSKNKNLIFKKVSNF